LDQLATVIDARGDHPENCAWLKRHAAGSAMTSSLKSTSERRAALRHHWGLWYESKPAAEQSVGRLTKDQVIIRTTLPLAAQ